MSTAIDRESIQESRAPTERSSFEKRLYRESNEKNVNRSLCVRDRDYDRSKVVSLVFFSQCAYQLVANLRLAAAKAAS